MSVARLQLTIQDPLGDVEELDRATLALRQRLLNDTNVSSVRQASDAVTPEGAKSGQTIAIASLIVMLSENLDTLATVVDVIRAWISRDANRSAKLTLDGDSIEVTGTSSAAQIQLIEAFIDRHDERRL
jgi:hypothetical protein